MCIRCKYYFYFHKKKLIVVDPPGSTSSQTDQCLTIAHDDGPQVGKPCVIPFTINGEVKDGCLWEKNESKPWCSTKVDENGAHVSGQEQWGYCGSNCPIATFTDTGSWN